MQQFPQYFRKRNKRTKALSRTGRSRAIRQFQNAVQHADGQGLAAHRTDIVQFHALQRFKHDIARAMSVQMVFAFVGKKFQGTRVLVVFSLQGRKHAVIGRKTGKQRSFTRKIFSGMSVRTGHHGQPIQPAPAAVHVRIGRKPRLRRKNMRRQIFKTFLWRIKTGF